MTQTAEASSPEQQAGRRRRFDFEDVVPEAITNPEESSYLEQLEPNVPKQIDLDRALGVGEGYAVVAEIAAAGEMPFYLLDISETPRGEDGYREVGGQRFATDFILVTEGDRTHQGAIGVTRPDRSLVTDENPNGNFRVGRGYNQDVFPYPEEGSAVSEAQFDIVVSDEGISIIDLNSTNGTALRQGKPREQALRIAGEEVFTPAAGGDVADSAETDGAQAEQGTAPGPEANQATEVRLNPAEVFASGEALLAASSNPNIDPADAYALRQIAETWQELEVARLTNEAWKELGPQIQEVQRIAAEEARGLIGHREELETIGKHLQAVLSTYDFMSQYRGDVERWRGDVAPHIPHPESMPKTPPLMDSTARNRLRATKENAIDAVARVAANVGNQLTPDEAAQLAAKVRNMGAEDRSIAQIRGALQSELTDDASALWHTRLEALENLLGYGARDAIEPSLYRRLEEDAHDLASNFKNKPGQIISADYARSTMDSLRATLNHVNDRIYTAELFGKLTIE